MAPYTGKTRSAGFTLIELLIVMAIIGMLAALVGPKLFSKFAGSQRDAASAQIKMIESALDTYRLDVGRYPDSLEALTTNPGGSNLWSGPYLKKGVPVDPWKNAYQYRRPGRHNNDYDLYSMGSDGNEGGEGDDADITNW
ncbi:type II secretion system major pseudopilin GspG [Endothiovibrio diazotrophicus]